MIETDEIEWCIGAVESDYETSTCREPGKKARKQLAALKALEPQWLPAGKLPDAAGWWLWWDYESGDYEPVLFFFKNGHLHREYRGTVINQTLFGCNLRDRFAPMPRWEAPK